MLRAHGLRGENVVDLVSNRPERAVAGVSFVVTGAAAPRRELRVAEIRPFQGRWLVRFEGVESREAAEALHGTVLRAEALADDEALWVHELVGARVERAADGAVLGTVTAVLANPASDLLELDGGALVPVRFVVEHGGGRVVVDVPEGLVE